MSISSEITRIQGNIADTYTAANAKGATLPVTQNSDNLASTIATIPSGITPTGTRNITSNGVYDVTNYASADVQVPTTAPSRYLQYSVDADGKLIHDPAAATVINLNGVTDISANILSSAYYGNTTLTGTVDFSSLKAVSGEYACSNMFNSCTGITSVDLSSLENVSGQNACYAMFQVCTGITSVDLSALKAVTYNSSCSYMFNRCTGITGALDLSALTAVTATSGCNSMFSACSGITSVDLSSLTAITNANACSNMFYQCTNLASVNLSHLCKLNSSSSIGTMFGLTSLTSLSFPSLAYTATNINGAFYNTLTGVTGCTVHFPSDWQTDMASYSNITNGLGGTNTTVLFDLPAVTTLDLSYITSIVGYNQFGYFASSNYFPNVTSVDLSSLTNISSERGCQGMFNGSTGITSVDLSSLTTVSGRIACQYMCQGCTGLTGAVDLSSLTTVSGSSACEYMFSGCTGITSVDLSSLETVSGSSGCGYMFKNCTSLTSLSFPALKTVLNAYVFSGMLDGVTGCTVHFPSNMSSYYFGCGGTNTTVLYDLPATVTLTGANTKAYERNPKYDTATALAWYEVGTDRFTTQYYTSGTTDPAVSDTIYSDSACTTPVTTISSIA